MVRSLLTLNLCAAVFGLGILVKSAAPTPAADPPILAAQVLHVKDILEAPLPSVQVRAETIKRQPLLQTPGTTIFVAQVVPDQTKHPAPANIFVYVVSGNGRVELDNTVVDVKIGDLVEIPKGTNHVFRPGSELLKLLVFAIPVPT